MFLTTTLVFFNQDKLFVSCQDKIRESNQCIFNRRLRIRIEQCQCFIAYFTHTLCSIIQSTRLFDHLTQYLGIFGITFDSAQHSQHLATFARLTVVEQVNNLPIMNPDIVTAIGFMLLLLLMLYVTFNDIFRLF